MLTGTARDNRAISALAVVLFIAGLSAGVPLSRINVMARELDLGFGALALLLLAAPAVGLLSEPLSLTLTPRRGSRRLIAILLPLACLAVFATGAAADASRLAVVIVAAAVFGTVYPWLLAASAGQLGAYAERRGIQDSPYIALVVPLGVISGAGWNVASSALGLSLTAGFGILLAAAAVAVVAVTPMLYGRSEIEPEPEPLPEPDGDEAPPEAIGRGWRPKRAPWQLTVILGLIAAVGAMVLFWGSVYLAEVSQGSDLVAPLAVASYEIGRHCDKFPGFRWLGRLPLGWGTATGLLFLLLGVIGIVILPEPATALTACTLASAGTGILSTHLDTVIGTVDPAGEMLLNVVVPVQLTFFQVLFIGVIGVSAMLEDLRVAFGLVAFEITLAVLPAMVFLPRLARRAALTPTQPADGSQSG